MAHYAYKEMLDSLPSELTKDWEGSADYDSELWTIGADYIDKLEKEKRELKDLLQSLWDCIPDGPEGELHDEIKKVLDSH